MKEARLQKSGPNQVNRLDAPCVILAGGQSRRFGSNKAIAPLYGQRMIDVLIKRIELQTTAPIAINATMESGLGDLNFPVLIDQIPGSFGPLAGIHAAMSWAEKQGYDAVVTTPVDTPLLPLNFIEQLVMAGAPSIAAFGIRQHVVHGHWPTSLIEKLARSIERGTRSARDWVSECHAVECVFHDSSGPDPFFNVNTLEDLMTLERAQPISPR